MNWFYRLTVGQRLFTVIFVATAALSVLAAFSLFELSRDHTAASYAEINTGPSLVALDGASNAMGVLRTHTYQHIQHILHTDPAGIAKVDDDIHAQSTGIAAAFKAYESLLSDQQDQVLLAAEHALFADGNSIRDTLLAPSRQNRSEEALLAALTALAPAGEKVFAGLARHRAYPVKPGKAGTATARDIMKQAWWGVAAVAAATLLLVLARDTLTVRKVLRQLGGEPVYETQIAGKIAAVNLGIMVRIRENDQGSLLFAMKGRRDKAVIDDSVVKVASDGDLVGAAGATMGDIVQGIRPVTAIMRQSAPALRRAGVGMA